MIMTQNGGRLISMALLATCTSCTSDSASLPTSATSPIQPAAVTIMRSSDLGDSDPPAIVKLNGAKIAELGAGQSHTNRVGSGPMILTVSAPSSPDTSGLRFHGRTGEVLSNCRIDED